MSTRYVAIGMSAAEFARDYPNAVGRPANPTGFAAFGPAPVQIAERLGRSDFASTCVYLVLVGDADLYLAFACAGEEPVGGYPPDRIKLQVTEWGDTVDPKAVRERVRSAPTTDGTDYVGVILPKGRVGPLANRRGTSSRATTDVFSLDTE